MGTALVPFGDKMNDDVASLRHDVDMELSSIRNELRDLDSSIGNLGQEIRFDLERISDTLVELIKRVDKLEGKDS